MKRTESRVDQLEALAGLERRAVYGQFRAQSDAFCRLSRALEAAVPQTFPTTYLHDGYTLMTGATITHATLLAAIVDRIEAGTDTDADRAALAALPAADLEISETTALEFVQIMAALATQF